MAITKPSVWSPGHILAAILPLLVVLAIAAVSLRAQPPAASADPDFVHAFYIGKVDRVVKLKAADGASLFEITDAQELRRADADEHQGVFWVYAQNTLRAYGFDGQFLFSAPVPPPEPDGREGERSRIDVDADARFLWVALKNQLRRHDIDTGALHLTKNIKNLKKVGSDSQGGVWFAANRVLGKLDAAGSEILRRNPLIS